MKEVEDPLDELGEMLKDGTDLETLGKNLIEREKQTKRKTKGSELRLSLGMALTKGVDIYSKDY